MVAIVTTGCTQNVPPSPESGFVQSQNSSPILNTRVTAPESENKIIAAYWYLFPDPNDDTYDLVMSEKDQIPWKKITRLYIGFATLNDGVLTDLPTGNSEENIAQREEMQNRIREVILLCHENNPDAEIFITSNFGGDLDNEYLSAAQDPQKFADSVLTYMKDYGFDGYDMDWESPKIDDYAPQLTLLLSTCHATFASAGSNPHGLPFLLTHTVWPGVESAQTVADLNGSVDQLNLMTYGSGEKYDLVMYADSYAAAGFPYDKMIGGVESESEYTDNIGPDTQTTVMAKCAFVKEHDLAGLFEWRIDNDMRPDNGPPTYQVTGWMHDCMTQ